MTETAVFSALSEETRQKRKIALIINFTPVAREHYRVGVPKRGNFTLVLDSGHGFYEKGDDVHVYRSKKGECDGQPFSFAYPLPAYGAAVFRF